MKLQLAVFSALILMACDDGATGDAIPHAVAESAAEGAAQSDAAASHDPSFEAEVATFTRDINQAAQKACGATDAQIAATDDSVAEPVDCYTWMAVDMEPCEHKAFAAHKDEARKLMACIRRDNEALIACCATEGLCTTDAIGSCFESLWQGDDAGPCEADLDLLFGDYCQETE